VYSVASASNLYTKVTAFVRATYARSFWSIAALAR
jgi:hypothetical protein